MSSQKKRRRKSSIRLTAIAGCSALLLGVVTYSVCHPGQEILVTGHDETGESMKEIPSSYQLEISDNKKINAKVVVPDAVSEKGYHSATAKMITLDEEYLYQYFDGQYHITEKEKVENGADENDCIYYGSTDGAAMFLYGNTIYGVDMETQLQTDIISTIRDIDDEMYNGNRFPREESLEKFSIEECDKRVSDFLDEAGNVCPIQIFHRTLDADILAEEAYALQDDGSYKKIGRLWTDDDKGYICNIFLLCNDTPIYDQKNLRYGWRLQDNSMWQMTVTRGKIASASLRAFYEINYSDACENMLSLDTVASLCAKQMQSMDEANEITITEIYLISIPLKVSQKEYQMRPVWLLQGTQKEIFEGMDRPYVGDIVYAIDAVSGDLL